MAGGLLMAALQRIHMRGPPTSASRPSSLLPLIILKAFLCWGVPERAEAKVSCLGNAEVALGGVAVIDEGERAGGDVNDCHAAAGLSGIVVHGQQSAASTTVTNTVATGMSTSWECLVSQKRKLGQRPARLLLSAIL